MALETGKRCASDGMAVEQFQSASGQGLGMRCWYKDFPDSWPSPSRARRLPRPIGKSDGNGDFFRAMACSA